VAFFEVAAAVQDSANASTTASVIRSLFTGFLVLPRLESILLP
jgi:hypothetical protein